VLSQRLDSVNDDKGVVLKSIRRYVARKIYEMVFPRRPTYKDLGIYYQLDSLAWVNCGHMFIGPEHSEEGLWQLASLSLAELDRAKTPEDQLAAIEDCFSKVYNILRLTSSAKTEIGADLVMPILVLVLIKARPKRLSSCLHFMRMFGRHEGRDDYNLLTLEGCLSFCQSAELTRSKLRHVSEEEFRANVEQREQLNQIYFLRRRAFE
jgi:hypothetical protein